MVSCGDTLPEGLRHLGRARLFEVVQKVSEVNVARKWDEPEQQFTGFSRYISSVKQSGVR